jgi:hypothetical protein
MNSIKKEKYSINSLKSFFNKDLINEHLLEHLVLSSQMLINTISNSPNEALRALPQLMLTVKASKVLAFTVFTSDDVAKKVGSSLVAK